MIFLKYIIYLLLSVFLISCSTVSDDISSEYYNIGNAYYDVGNFEKAIEYYNRALAGGSSNENIIRFNLAVAYSESDRLTEGLKHFEFLLEQDPQNLKVLQSVAYAYFLLGNQVEALSVYNQILEIFEFDNTALYNKALILIDDDKDEAESTLEKLYAIDSSSEVALLLGGLYEGRGDWESFSEVMEKALIVDGKNVEILDSLSLYHEKFDRYDKSLFFLGKLIEYDVSENLSALYFRKALIELLKTEDFDAGLRSLERALDEGFNDQEQMNLLLESGNLKNTTQVEDLVTLKGFFE